MPSSPNSTPSHHHRLDTTQWSQVLGASDADDPGLARRAMTHLCQTYWYPLYAYARRKGSQPADAEDLTQGFLSLMIDKDRFAGIHPSKGKLRTFLLSCFEHYLRDDHIRKGAVKRGGDVTVIPLDWVEAEARYAEQGHAAGAPERDFDLAWALKLLENALERLKSHYASTGKSTIYAALHPFLTGEAAHGDFLDAAEILNMAQSSARSAATRMRQQYRAFLREEVACTVADGDQADDEFKEICEILRGS